MKRILTLLLIIGLSVGGAMAQNKHSQKGKNGDSKRNNAPTQRDVQQHKSRDLMHLRGKQGELFTVYVDGLPINNSPQGIVTLPPLSNELHEVVVVLNRPDNILQSIYIMPSSGMTDIEVSYNQRTRTIMLDSRCNCLYTAQQAFAVPTVGMIPPPINPNNQLGAETPVVVRGTSESEVESMVQRLKALDFDQDRMTMCRTIVPDAALTAAQISRLAATFDFNNNQVDFLKFAFQYCIDPENYYKTADILTYSSDKQTILKYIQEHR